MNSADEVFLRAMVLRGASHHGTTKESSGIAAARFVHLARAIIPKTRFSMQRSIEEKGEIRS